MNAFLINFSSVVFVAGLVFPCEPVGGFSLIMYCETAMCATRVENMSHLIMFTLT